MLEINIDTTIGDLNTLAVKIAIDFVAQIDNLRADGSLGGTPFPQIMKMVNELIDERVSKVTNPLYRKFIELWVLDIAEKALKRKFENVSINA
jgi:hypothetical protein